MSEHEEMAPELPEPDEVEVVAHSDGDEEEEPNDWCVFNNSNHL
jgi:hypothetical protein